MARTKKASFNDSFERAMRAASPKELSFAGYNFTSGPGGTQISRQAINTKATRDYGADPVGDGTFKMVPSGDIVDFEERNRRLKR